MSAKLCWTPSDILQISSRSYWRAELNSTELLQISIRSPPDLLKISSRPPPTRFPPDLTEEQSVCWSPSDLLGSQSDLTRSPLNLHQISTRSLPISDLLQLTTRLPTSLTEEAERLLNSWCSSVSAGSFIPHLLWSLILKYSFINSLHTFSKLCLFCQNFPHKYKNCTQNVKRLTSLAFKISQTHLKSKHF